MIYQLRPDAGVMLGGGWDIKYPTLTATVQAQQMMRIATHIVDEVGDTVAWGEHPTTGEIVDMANYT